VIELTTELRPRSIYISPLRGFSVAFVFIFGLVLFGLIDQVRTNPRLFWSFMGAVAVLLAWSAVLFPSVANALTEPAGSLRFEPQKFTIIPRLPSIGQN